MRRSTVAFTIALSALLAACGSSATEAGTSDTSTAETSEEETDTTEAMEDEATHSTDAMEDDEEEGEAMEDGAAGEGVPVSLTEFAIGTDAAMAVPGTVTFDIVNDGGFPHEFGVAKGDSYHDFALTEDGAIDEEVLGADILDKTAELKPGETETISFDLEPGNYVFFCNVNPGRNNHARAGQVLSVTVG